MNKIFKKVIFVGVMLSLGSVVRTASFEDKVQESMAQNKGELFTHMHELTRVNSEIERVVTEDFDEDYLNELRKHQQAAQANIVGLLGLGIEEFDEVVPSLESFFGDSPAYLAITSPSEVAEDFAAENLAEQVADGQSAEYRAQKPMPLFFDEMPPELVTFILSNVHGKDLDAAEFSFKNCLLGAADLKLQYKKLVKELLEKHNGNAPHALKEAIENNIISAVKPLLEMGLASCGEYKPGFATETSRYNSDQERQFIQRNALEWAVYANNEVIARLLVEECDVDVDHFFTNTLLGEVARMGTVDHMRLLLELGANPNICGLRQVHSPLILAFARGCDFEKIRLLCDYSAIVATASSRNGASALEVASKNGYVEAVQILIDKLREELGALELEEKLSRELVVTGCAFSVQYGREIFTEQLNKALQAARAAGHDNVVAVLEQALEEGLPEPAGPATKQEKK